MTDFKAKMHEIRFRLGLRPRPRWGSLQFTPRPLSWIWGPLRGREERLGCGRGGRGGGEGEGGEVEGREREGPQVTVEPGPLGALLRHWSSKFLFPIWCSLALSDMRSIFRRCSWMVECHVFRDVRLFLFLLPLLFLSHAMFCTQSATLFFQFHPPLCSSVRPSHCGIVYKRNYTSSNFSQYLVGASPGFLSHTTVI